MAIDPAHLPIFGDPRPSEAPAVVRAARGLFITQVVLSTVHLTLVWARSGLDLSLYLVPLAVTVWLAVSMSAGRDWARIGVVVVSGLSVLLSIGLTSGPVDVALLVPIVAAVGVGTYLVYRPDVREFFEPAEDDEVRTRW
ncbi:hypothetical protein [Actinokineospora xionganensis]|uniref:Low temperature requirement A protein (LtrA) n=1 Tax=Actinokineospora xionganensis TaxID=2684470 RepID=A0ABR7L024_9PSEU|nr:hypothetical protein [Actinokineospora xionganensis]MBC6446042.1 hypothetical protein [Actinokineospora xionganensis]